MAEQAAAKRQKVAGTPAGEIEAVVREAVREVEVIDLHTHLMPPSFGEMMLWGVDELLTYHYLVCEFFQTATDIHPDRFYALPKDQQGDMIWEALFVQRSPISEQCRGVVTTLQRLGLGELVQTRDIKAIRAWFQTQTPESYTDLVLDLAKIKYVVMTNIPFDRVRRRRTRRRRRRRRRSSSSSSRSSSSSSRRRSSRQQPPSIV
eukprot:SAG22_NODE_1639_length_3911_cov_21.500787_2_plen_205_part_00